MSLTAVVDAVIEHALPCHLVEPDLFFAESPVDVERAKALCIDCPMRTTCLAGAVPKVPHSQGRTRLLMVAAHAWDLRGAQAVGMRTAYVERPVG